MSSRIDVLVVGGANFDYLVKGSRLPRAGETVAGETLHEAPGGKGANQALAATRLGARTAFVARIGSDDRGKRILKQLADEGVDTRRCVVDETRSTGVALIMVDARGEKAILTAPGANAHLSPNDVERAAPVFANAKVVLLQLEPGLATTLTAARQARASRALVVLDAGPPAQVPEALLATVDVVRANAGEATAITGIEVTGIDSARAAAHELRRPGGGAACVATAGGDLLVFGDGDEVWLPHQHVDVVDATGAGDAFAAGIAVGLAEGQSLTDAAWLGCAAAALKTTRLGAQAGLPDRREVDRFLATIRRDDRP